VQHGTRFGVGNNPTGLIGTCCTHSLFIILIRQIVEPSILDEFRLEIIEAMKKFDGRWRKNFISLSNL
jgi:hypothetical protein